MTSSWVILLVSMGLSPVAADDKPLKVFQCPEPVRKTITKEANGSKIGDVTKEAGGEGDEEETVYWVTLKVNDKVYSLGVLEDGTISEMSLAVGEDEEIRLDAAPAPVQATFKSEGFGQKVVTVSKDVKFGLIIYEAVVDYKFRQYELVVAEDGSLVEKVLIVNDEEVELAKCPEVVQAAFKKESKGGKVGDITKSAGINRPTYEAEVEIDKKVYLIEVAENGTLISKSLEASEEPEEK